MNLNDSPILKTIVDSAPIGICILNADSFIVDMLNDKFLEIAGKPKEAILGKWYWEPFAEAKAYYEEAMAGVIITKKTFHADEVRLMLIRNGKEEWIHVTFVYAPVMDEKGVVTKLAVWVLENTTQVHEREQLATANDRIEQEREKAQQANSNLEQILNMLPASVVVIRGYDLIVEMINDSNLAYWQRNREEVIGKPFLEILPDLADQPFAGQLRRVMKTGEDIDVKESPVLFTDKEGNIRDTYVDYTYQPLADLDGNWNGVLVMSFEITDRVLARRLLEKYTDELSVANDQLSIANNKLVKSEARFKYLIEKAPVAIGVLHGRELILEMANQKVLEVWGKNATIVGLPLSIALPELEGQPFLGLLDDVFTSGEAFYANEIRAMLEHDGELKEIFFNVVYQPVFGTDGAVADILIVAVDVTQQVNSRRKVEQAELTMRLAVEAGNVGTWSVDRKTYKQTTSSRLKEMFGFHADEEITIEDTFGLVTADYKAKLTAIFKEAMASNGTCDFAFTINRKDDGELRWLRALGSCNLEVPGDPSAFAGVMLDITDIKADEQRKSDFIGMVSHELKTPLTSLSGYLQLLQRKAEKGGDNFSKNAFENSLKQVRQMTTMINGFLDISRLESGKIHIDRTKFDLSELFTEVDAEHQFLYAGHNLIFEKGESVSVYADREKIAQVINNLISNAVKYSATGTTVEIFYELKEDVVKISVRDQGIGIKQEDIDKLFERYYRVENNGNVSGFGIGLYLSAEIIARHEGRIWAESEIGVGSTFYFELESVSI
ncbi:MAG: PAS domain S-box protein [Pedobacter sp.]|nr:MAG: PAS domain S-box protein [Pedobacter sp.]